MDKTFRRTGITALLLAGTLLFSLSVFIRPPMAHAAPHSGGGRLLYVHTASSENISGDTTYLDDTNIDGLNISDTNISANPQAFIQVTPVLTSSDIYDDHPLGVFYDSVSEQWGIFNQDGVPMVVGAAFNVDTMSASYSSDPVGNPADSNEGDFTFIATSSNVTWSSASIDFAFLNDQPQMSLIVTPNWNPYGIDGAWPDGVSNSDPIGVWYDSTVGRWAVFNQDGTPMPVGAAFNISYYNTATAFIANYSMIHTATPANTMGNETVIDAGFLNGQPDAIVTVTANWNPGGLGGTYNPHNIGVWYNPEMGQWVIFNQDGSAIPNGTSFNVFG